MKNLFIVQKSDKYNFAVTGKDIYDDHTNLEEKKITFEDSVSFNVLIKVSSNEEESVVDESICEHIDHDFTIVDTSGDGLYKVKHYIIPTVEYVKNCGHHFDNVVYAYSNSKFYKLLESIWYEVSSAEIIESNPCSLFGITESEIFTFTMQELRDCYKSIVEPLLCDLCDGCYDVKNNQDILNRDLVWMAINCIQYSLDDGNFFEAQRILERILTCSGPCSSKNKRCGHKQQGGCNCGRH